MKVTIKHQSRGRVRVQMDQARMTLEQADLEPETLTHVMDVLRAEFE